MVRPRESKNIVYDISRSLVEHYGESLFARFTVIFKSSVCETERVGFIDGIDDPGGVQRIFRDVILLVRAQLMR